MESKEKHKQRMREYYLKNKDKFLSKSIIWKRKNPKKVSAYAKRYRATHREKANEYRKKRMLETFSLLGNCCARCSFSDVRAFQVHHRDGTKEHKLDFLRKNFDLGKVELLCSNCHSIHHSGWKIS